MGSSEYTGVENPNLANDPVFMATSASGLGPQSSLPVLKIPLKNKPNNNSLSKAGNLMKNMV